MFPFLPYLRAPLHLWDSTFECGMGRQRGEYPMVRTFKHFPLCEGSRTIREFGPTCRTRTGRANRGGCNRSVTCITEYSHRGAPIIGICTEIHWAVHLHASAVWSPCNCPPPGKGKLAVNRLVSMISDR